MHITTSAPSVVLGSFNMVYDYVIVDSKLLAYNSSYYRREPILNFLNIVMNALTYNRIRYKKIIWAHDINKSAYRLDLWEGYKGGRKDKQDKEHHEDQSRREEFVAKYKRLPSILKYIGLQVNHIPKVTNYEADDVPNLIKELDPEARLLLISLDGDWVLNLDERTHILKYDTNTLIDSESYIYEKYGMSKDSLKEAWEIIGQEKDSIYGIKKLGLKRWANNFAHLPEQERYEQVQEWLDERKYGCSIDHKAKYNTWQDNWELNKKLMTFMTINEHTESDVKFASEVIKGEHVEPEITYREWIELCLMELNEVPPIDQRTFEALQRSIH